MLVKATKRVTVMAFWRALGTKWGVIGKGPAVFC